MISKEFTSLMTNHFEKIDNISYTIDKLAKAFEMTGNRSVAIKLRDLSLSLEETSLYTRDAFQKETWRVLEASCENSHLMLKAAIAGIELNQMTKTSSIEEKETG